MKKIILKASYILAFLACPHILISQNLYNVNTIQNIEINFAQADWDYQMDTAKAGEEKYLMASSLIINGTMYDSVGVKYKGNSSYDPARLKNPLHIALDKYKKQKHNGFTDLKLSNGYGDPSLAREVLAYQILGNYMHCPRSSFAKVYINGSYIGVYSNDENIDTKFLGDHFYSSGNTFVKCNPINNPGPTTKSNFKYINADSTSYEPYYEVKTNHGWSDLINLCDTITNQVNSLEQVIDMDRVLWMLAFNNLFVNLDSYNGVFSQNHYTYKDKTNHFNPILWDLNMCFGAFPYAGAGTTSLGFQPYTAMPSFATNNHATDAQWPLINAVMNNPTWKRKYFAHMKTMLQENIVSGNYKTSALQFQSLIDSSVLADTNKFFDYSKFQNSLDSNYQFGSYTVPGIVSLMEARKIYLQSLVDFNATAPTITSITPSSTNPAFNSNIDFNASISNATNVALGYRFDKTLKFTKVQMFDDGAHNDGGANDNIFGFTIPMTGAQLQYYVYAENADAGIFNPARAEHEFHTLISTSSLPNAGDLVINELLADNIGGEKDEYDDSEDWVELFNTTNKVLDLSNCHLSDKVNNMTKWNFPSGTYILPNSYLIVWTDDDSLEYSLHTNFSLNKDSSTLILSNASNIILDSISFQNQSSNISYGRYPNGTGAFQIMNTTFNGVNNNDPLSIGNSIKNNSFLIFPNPAQNKVNIMFEGKATIKLFSMLGVLLSQQIGFEKVELNTSQLANGMYFIDCHGSVKKLLIQK